MQSYLDHGRRIHGMKVLRSNVKVGPRFRMDYGNLDDLAASIQKFGLIQPIVVDKDLNLVCGGRRFKACEQAGIEEIEVTMREEINPLTLKELELEENIQRKDFTWHEICLAKQDLHELKQVQAAFKGGQWTMEDTARITGESVGIVNQDIQLARALKDHPELLGEPSKTIAFKKLKKIEEDRMLSAMMDRARLRRRDTDEQLIFCADCLDYIKESIQDNQVDLIITDPPWGVGMEESGQLIGKVEYDDNEETVKQLLSKVYPELYRVLRPGGHIFLFFGIQHYQWNMERLTAAGFTIDPIPGLWTKGSHGGTYSPNREGNSYEVYFHGWKETPRELKNFVPNDHHFNRVSPDAKIHTAEKPIGLIEELIENASFPAGLVLDPFGGSGVTARAALTTTRRAICIEKNPEVYDKATKALEKFREDNEL